MWTLKIIGDTSVITNDTSKKALVVGSSAWPQNLLAILNQYESDINGLTNVIMHLAETIDSLES